MKKNYLNMIGHSRYELFGQRQHVRVLFPC